MVGNFPEGGTEREIGVFSLRATIVVMVMVMAIVVVMMTMTMEEKKIGL